MALIKRLASCALAALLVSLSAQADSIDFSGFWSILGYDETIRPPQNTQYTEEGQRRLEQAQAFFEKTGKTPADFCLHEGMPWTMLSRARDYQYEIFQTPERIVVTWEPMETTRHIRLNADFPEQILPHRQGYSVARWDGKALKIETRGFNATNEISERIRSDKAQIAETWQLIQHPEYGEVLEITMLIDDPVMYQQPASGKTLLKRSPGGAQIMGYHCTEALWDDFVADNLD